MGTQGTPQKSCLSSYIFFGLSKLYFAKHRLNTDADAVVDTSAIESKAYDAHLHALLEAADPLDTSLSCKQLVPEASHEDATFALYIQMNSSGDYETWLQLAKCWKLWDIDVRGFHRGVWRFFQKQRPILVVGVPYSEFGSHKPASLKPLFIPKPKKKEE
eukprot:m.78619 g.78619  ORF g.78619 m.78619 type:complete len:160 (+) comp14122_c0_seq2:126-605(+)